MRDLAPSASTLDRFGARKQFPSPRLRPPFIGQGNLVSHAATAKTRQERTYIFSITTPCPPSISIIERSLVVISGWRGNRVVAFQMKSSLWFSASNAESVLHQRAKKSDFRIRFKYKLTIMQLRSKSAHHL
jgi:hypothetical protein